MMAASAVTYAHTNRDVTNTYLLHDDWRLPDLMPVREAAWRFNDAHGLAENTGIHRAGIIALFERR